MHDELVNAERQRAKQRQRRRKKRRKGPDSRVTSHCDIGSDEEEHSVGGLLTATHKLWTARLVGVGVSVRGRTRCNREVSLPMNATLTGEDWQGMTMDFLQTRSDLMRTQQEQSNISDGFDNYLDSRDDESPEDAFRRAVEQAMQAARVASTNALPNMAGHKHRHERVGHTEGEEDESEENIAQQEWEQEQTKLLRRTTHSGFRLPAIQ